MTADDIRKLISLIDLTSLNDNDDISIILSLCNKAITPIGTVAAVCVYPRFVKDAKLFLQDKTVKVATVINFPSGDENLEKIVRDTTQAISDGADEIDIVFPYKTYLKGNKADAINIIKACKAACSHDTALKVILETGELPDRETVAEISEAVLNVGADFIKTSTGKVAVGVTPESAATMLNMIRNLQAYHQNKCLGFKASGGVKTVNDAMSYINLAKYMLGEGFLKPESFRIGASGLLDDALSIHKEMLN
jgi:deoxyribose-phosphate aldolase